MSALAKIARRLGHTIEDISAVITRSYRQIEAASAVGKNKLVQVTTDGKVEETAAFPNTAFLGVNTEGHAVSASRGCRVGRGYHNVVFGAPVDNGTACMPGVDGRAVGLPIGSVTTISDEGGAFTNQPTNDGVEVVSASVADTTQTVEIIGITGTTVTRESVTLNGTTGVATTKVDWDEVLAVKITGTTAGVVTVREASGNQTITTIAAGTNGTSGVYTPTTSEAITLALGYLSFNVKSDGATTKNAGARMQTGAGTTADVAWTMNGTTDVAVSNTTGEYINELYVGDFAATGDIIVTPSSTPVNAQLHEIVSLTDTSGAVETTGLAFIG